MNQIQSGFTSIQQVTDTYLKSSNKSSNVNISDSFASYLQSQIDEARNEYNIFKKGKVLWRYYAVENLIIYLSDMILIVVGKITFNEQKLINKIKKELEENEDQKDNRIYKEFTGI